MAAPKQHQAILGGTKTRVQKSQLPLFPTLSRSHVVASFQLNSVRSSASTVLPPNPAACLRIGVWDKPWDKYANYFETASPQFRFARGQNGLVLRPETSPPNQAARWNHEIPSPRLGPSVPKRLRNPEASSMRIVRFLLLAIRNRLVDKLVECRTLLCGSNRTNDGLPYDVAVLVDNAGGRGTRTGLT